MTETATMLTGPLGLGHEMMARGCGRLLERSGWHVRQLDSMSLLGPWRGGAGERLFKGLVAVPGLYDGLHFAHLRTGSRLADRIDRASNARLVPALRAELERHPADLLFSVFATGASAAGKLKAEMPGLKSVVLCTDVSVHRIWSAEGTDLFLVTSPAAEASVRRYLPRAPVAVVPPPVRPEFYAAPPQQQARQAFGVAADVIVALPGAVTCAEARVVGRHLLLLDVMPGHGRDNLQHELELGDAGACVPTPGGVTASVLALRDEAVGPFPSRVLRWEPAYIAALRRIGLDLQSWKEPSAHVAHAIPESAVV